MAVYYKILAGILLLYASWVDWRTFRIPYVSIIGVAVLGLAFLYETTTSWLGVFLLPLATGTLLLAICWSLEKRLKKPILGYGDIQLIVACLFWINLEQLPLFLIYAGAIIILTSLFYYKRHQYLPAAHAIGLAWLLILL